MAEPPRPPRTICSQAPHIPLPTFAGAKLQSAHIGTDVDDVVRVGVGVSADGSLCLANYTRSGSTGTGVGDGGGAGSLAGGGACTGSLVGGTGSLSGITL